MADKKLKIGIIGCGDIANEKHMPSLKKFSDICEMTAFCDIRIERAKKAAKEYGVKNADVYENHKELLKDETIDIVHILTPNVSHSPIAIAAFKADKHVMCEKPMAHNKEAAEKMMEFWQKSNKKFTIGYQNRFKEEVLDLKESCNSERLGEIYFAKAHAVRRKAVPTWGVFLKKEKQGGGSLVDIGSHALDLTLWLMNNYKPQSVTGSVFHKMKDKLNGNLFGRWEPENFEGEDSAFGFIKMKDGTTIFLESSWILNTSEPKEASTTLFGTKSGAEIRSGLSWDQTELIYNRIEKEKYIEKRVESIDKKGPKFDEKKDLGYLEAESWLNSIINDKEPVVNPKEAFIVTKIMDAIYESDEKGKEIKFT